MDFAVSYIVRPPHALMLRLLCTTTANIRLVFQKAHKATLNSFSTAAKGTPTAP